MGLPLLVLASLSLHLIALLILLLLAVRPAGAGSGHAAESTGAVVILSKEITPERPSRPPLPPPPPPSPLDAARRTPPPPAPTAAAQSSAALAGRNGPRAHGGVVFLLDISGSMYEAYAGATRLALARKFIGQQIAALPDGTPFAIALYGETTRRSGPLVAAGPATRTAAQAYLQQDFDCGGGTNLPAGFDTAEELRPASIVLVSDGDLNIADDKLLKETRRILGRPGPQLSVFGIAPRAGTNDAQQLEEVARQQTGRYQTMDVVAPAR